MDLVWVEVRWCKTDLIQVFPVRRIMPTIGFFKSSQLNATMLIIRKLFAVS